MIEYLFGSILDWDMLALMNAVVPTIAFFLIFFIPESPSWLISSKKDKARCRASLRRLRDNVCDIDTEMEDLFIFSNMNESLSIKGKIKLICQPFTYNPFMIVMVYTVLSQFSGYNVVTFYAIDVLKVCNDLKIYVFHVFNHSSLFFLGFGI